MYKVPLDLIMKHAIVRVYILNKVYSIWDPTTIKDVHTLIHIGCAATCLNYRKK